MFMLSSEFVFTEKLYSGIVAFSEYPKFSTSLTLSFPIKSIAFCFAVFALPPVVFFDGASIALVFFAVHLRK